MWEVATAVAVVVGVVVVGILVILTIEIKNTLRRFNQFIQNTEENMTPTLNNLNQSLERINRILQDVEDFSSNTREVSDNVKALSERIKDTAGSVERLIHESTTTISALRAGFRAGLSTLLKNLIRGGE